MSKSQSLQMYGHFKEWNYFESVDSVNDIVILCMHQDCHHYSAVERVLLFLLQVECS